MGFTKWDEFPSIQLTPCLPKWETLSPSQALFLVSAGSWGFGKGASSKKFSQE